MIYDVTIKPDGELYSSRVIDPESLEPVAVAVCRRWIEAGGGTCPVDHFARLSLQWTAPIEGIAFATIFSGGVPLTTSLLLASGLPADDDRRATGTMQSLIVQLVKRHAPDAEAGYDVLSIRDRPIIISLVLSPHDDLPIVADMEMCLVSAYLSKQ